MEYLIVQFADLNIMASSPIVGERSDLPIEFNLKSNNSITDFKYDKHLLLNESNQYC